MREAKICYIYVEDVIPNTDHMKHIDAILKSLSDANMRAAQEKTKFFKDGIKFLGSVVTKNGAKLKNVFCLRSFLGLASYYRGFIKDFAAIAKPVTNILKEENGSVSKHMSKKVKIKFNEI